MRTLGLLAVATLSLLIPAGPVTAAPSPSDSSLDSASEVARPAVSPRRAGVTIRDGRDNDGFDIKRVDAYREAAHRDVMVDVRFRRFYSSEEIVVWNVYLNTDKDRRPEFVVISRPSSYSGQVFRSKGWNGLATGRPLTRCGGAVRNGLVLGVRFDRRCLGLKRAKKVRVVAQETYSVDGYDGSADDWAPGKRKWSSRF